MVDIEIFIKRFENLDKFLFEKGDDILIKQADKIVALNNAQLMKGKGTDGNVMQRGYSPGYSKLRKKKGLQTSYVDLKFSGKYQDSRKGVKAKGGIDIKSDVDYEKYLRGNFPTHVGLTKESAEEIKKSINKEIAKEIQNYLIR